MTATEAKQEEYTLVLNRGTEQIQIGLPKKEHDMLQVFVASFTKIIIK